MTRFCLRHPVSTWMFFTGFVILGIYALPKLQIEAIPEVDLPKLTVSTRWAGASPKAVHRAITLPIEQAAGQVHGVEKVSSTSRGGESQVEISFRRGIDVEFARLELNEQLGSVRRELPLNASPPQIEPFVPEEFADETEFFILSLESPLSPNELRDKAETWILPQILAVEGVADARIQGGARSLLKIILDRRKLELYGIGADEIFSSIDELDLLAGAGVIRQEGVEKLMALRDPVDTQRLERAVLARRGGQSFRLNMLGRVEPSYEEPEYFVRADGKNVVQITVEKRSGANTVAVSQALRDALPALFAGLPFSATFHVDDDQGEDLRERLTELVYRSLAILVILFLLLAATLRQIRLTTVVIASIAFTIVISLSLFYFLNLSVNFITISGLTVCFGLILDNSILVLDSIHRRMKALERAEDAKLTRKAKMLVAMEIIVSGTREVSFPILATTLTTIVAFLAFIFLSGRLALFYVPLAVSVATAMTASLFVAFGWIPVALNQGWAAPMIRRSPDGNNSVTDSKTIHEFVEDIPDLNSPLGFLENIFNWSQRLWWVILPPVTALVIWGFTYVYQDKVIKGGFWRFPDQEELLLYVEMPAGTDILMTTQILAGFEEALLPIPEGARMTSTTWSGNRGVIRVEFEDELLATEYPTKYRIALVEVADATGGASIFIRGFSERPYFKGPFRGSALNSLVKLTGYNSGTLSDIAETAQKRIEKNRRARNARVTSGRRFDRSFQDEMVLSINRDLLAEHGLSVAEVVGYVRRLLGVDTPWSMLIDGRQKRIQLSFEDSETIQFSDMAGKILPTSQGEQIKLGDLIHLETRQIQGSLIREDQRYTMFLNWEYVGTDRMRRNYIQKVMDEMDLPYGYTAEEATQEFITPEEEKELTRMAVLAALFIFILLAALFESLSLPLLVMLSLPLALFGVFMAFWITDTTFDSSARIGLVLLFGIVVNNAILLASRFRTESSLILKARLGGDPESEAALFPGLRKLLGGSDLNRLEASERATLLRRAVARGTRVRLRSILLTSSTTAVGLAPLLIHFGESEGGEIWENLALASIGGLVSSTILILLALPPLYYAVIRVKWWMISLGGRMASKMRRVRNKPRPKELPSEV